MGINGAHRINDKVLCKYYNDTFGLLKTLQFKMILLMSHVSCASTAPVCMPHEAASNIGHKVSIVQYVLN